MHELVGDITLGILFACSGCWPILSGSRWSQPTLSPGFSLVHSTWGSRGKEFCLSKRDSRPGRWVFRARYGP